jgi:hypothetical protein
LQLGLRRTAWSRTCVLAASLKAKMKKHGIARKE